MEKQTFSAKQHLFDSNLNGKFTKHILFQTAEHTVFVLHFAAGQALPAHKHPGACLYATLLDGSGTVTVNGTDVELQHGDVIQVEGDEEFSFRSSHSTESSLYVTLIKI